MSHPFSPTLPGSSTLEKRVGYDVWLLAVTLGLCVCGAIFVLTSSAAHSWKSYGGDSLAIFRSHVGRLSIGLVCMAVLAFTDYHVLKRLARALWLVALALLIAVLFIPQPPGATAHRWIYLHGISFQPAELAKFALINYLALRFGATRDDPFANDRKKAFMGSALASIMTIALLLLEPNLSMVLLIFGTVALMFFLAEIPLRPMFIVGGASIVPLGLIAWLTPYMRVRLTAYIDGIINPLQASYHVKQSLIGLGQGGVTGIGLGASTQKFFFLPEPYKDFIFSIVGEELGLVGGVLLLVAFGFLLVRAWQIMLRAPDGFGRFLAAGITCTIGLSVVVNIGVTLGVLPATGQPLPFISYGGSSLMMTLGAIGVLLNISRQSAQQAERFDYPREVR